MPELVSVEIRLPVMVKARLSSGEEVDDIDTITVIAKMRIIEVRFLMAYKIIVNDYLVGYRIRNYNEIALKMQEQ